jgi:catechol 2,3-dioxygenase
MQTLPATTRIQHIHLQVSNLAQSLIFYSNLMGFQVVQQTGRTAYLSTTGQEPFQLILTEVADAIPKPRNSTGLYHVAILLPNRLELGRLFKRLVEHQWPFQGFSDHAVSEALYLPDPDGNGLELYRDRPRSEWLWENGQLYMTTAPLDVESLLAEADSDGQPWNGIPADTAIGHVHLHVNNLLAAEKFYHEVIGLDVMVAWHSHRASFLAAGGYHHHLGINTWAGESVPPPPPNAAGLRSFALAIDSGFDDALQRLQAAGISPETTVDYGSTGGVAITDPAGNVVELLQATG